MLYFKQTFIRDSIAVCVCADASMKANRAVAFLVSDDNITFVMAKNCVAPLKSLTLPKVELMAAVIASRVTTFIQDALQLQDDATYFWGDSQIVLYWLASTKQFPQFVQN